MDKNTTRFKRMRRKLRLTLGTPISNLTYATIYGRNAYGLNYKMRKALMLLEIGTIEDLILCDESKVQQWTGMGPKAVKSITDLRALIIADITEEREYLEHRMKEVTDVLKKQ